MQVDSPRGTEPSSGPPEAAREEGALARLGIRFTNWAERWFPDAYVFAALGVIPILFLAQLAFIVAFGVLLDTFVVRSLLVPAAAYDLGWVIWWPSKLWRRNGQRGGGENSTRTVPEGATRRSLRAQAAESVELSPDPRDNLGA